MSVKIILYLSFLSSWAKFYLILTSVIKSLVFAILIANSTSPYSNACKSSSIGFFNGPMPENINLRVGRCDKSLGAIAKSYPAPILFIKAPKKSTVSSDSLHGIHFESKSS
jgi:hypothetical protein